MRKVLLDIADNQVSFNYQAKALELTDFHGIQLRNRFFNMLLDIFLVEGEAGMTRLIPDLNLRFEFYGVLRRFMENQLKTSSGSSLPKPLPFNVEDISSTHKHRIYKDYRDTEKRIKDRLFALSNLLKTPTIPANLQIAVPASLHPQPSSLSSKPVATSTAPTPSTTARLELTEVEGVKKSGQGGGDSSGEEEEEEEEGDAKSAPADASSPVALTSDK